MLGYGVYVLFILAPIGLSYAEPCRSSSCNCVDVDQSCATTGPLYAPTDLTGHLIRRRTIMLTWNIPPDYTWNCELIGYKILYHKEGETEPYNEQIVSCSENSFSFVISDLQSIYEFKIAAFNSKGESGYSPGIFVGRSLNRPTVTVTNVTASVVNSGSVLVRWVNPRPVYVEGYILSASSLEHVVNLTIPVNSTSVYLNNLHMDTQYSITLSAYNSAGRGPESTPIQISTKMSAKLTTNGTCQNFDCMNGRCIPFDWVCDGEDDCGNLRDEKICTLAKQHCLKSDFMCNDGTCIPGTWRCDQMDDCGDNSDEIDCNMLTSGCGGLRKLSGLEGAIPSRNDDFRRPLNKTCTWDVFVPDDMFIKLHFYAFHIREHGNCSEYVSINMKNGQEKERFCGGSRRPADIVLASNHIQIVFMLWTTRIRDIAIKWSAVPASQPGNGTDNLSTVASSFLLTTSSSLQPLVTKETQVTKSMITSVQTSTNISSLKPTVPSPITNSTSGQLTSPTVIPTVVQPTNVSKTPPILQPLVCGKVFSIDNETSGYIDTTDLVGTFDMQCLWYVEAPEGYTIRFHFTDFNLDEFAYCLHDSIIIIDGKEPGIAVSGPYCGATMPPDIITYTNFTKLIFQLDPVNSTHGFVVEFHAVEKPKEVPTSPRPRIHCDREINFTTPGYIASPFFGHGLYPENLRCIYKIVGPSGYVIRLHFNAFDVEYSQNCMFDALTVTDGAPPSGELLTTVCGQMFPDDVISKTNSLFLSFISDSNKGGAGFNITYSAENSTQVDIGNLVEKMCRSGTVITKNDTTGEILSPRYAMGGRKYPDNINCSWLIEAPPGKVITLTFNDFGVEKERDCLYDALSIYDNNGDNETLIRKLCGPSYPNRLTSTGNQLFLMFYSDESGNDSGFNITYRVHDAIPFCQTDEFRCSNGNCIKSSLVCNDVQDCSDGSDEIVCSKFDHNCGVPTIQPVNISNKVVGGQEAKPGSWPWQVSLKHVGDHLCGGTLIHPQWIVTASHCFEQDRSPKRWTAILAQQHLYKDDPGTVVAPIQTIVVNDDYESYTTNNDIALVKLQTPVVLNDKIDTVCLPESQVSVGTVCYVTGFGEVLGTCCPYVLKQAAIPVIDTDKCNDTSRLAGQITDNMFCAGYDNGGIDACHGDSGGPFVCLDSKGRWELSGITSFGIGCGDARSPGVYTLVAKYISWIHQNIADYS